MAISSLFAEDLLDFWWHSFLSWSVCSQVGNCHMQLSSLYLSLGHREKAVQSYVIALEQCEAMLT